MFQNFAHYALKFRPKYLTAILYGANYVVRKRKNVVKAVFIKEGFPNFKLVEISLK